MRKGTYILVVGLAAIGLLVAGCGGDDDSNASGDGVAGQNVDAGGEGNSESDEVEGSEADAGKSEFVAQARQVCRRAEKTFQRKTEKAAWEPSRFLNRLVADVLRSEAKGIEGLKVPPGDEAEVEMIVGQMQKGARLLANPKRSAEGNEAYVEVERLSSDYGLHGCPSR